MKLRMNKSLNHKLSKIKAISMVDSVFYLIHYRVSDLSNRKSILLLDHPLKCREPQTQQTDIHSFRKHLQSK